MPTNYCLYLSTSNAQTICVLIRNFERRKRSVHVSVPMTPASVQCLTRPTSTSPTNGRNTSRRNVTATPQTQRHRDNQCDGWTSPWATMYYTLHRSYSMAIGWRTVLPASLCPLLASAVALLPSFCPLHPPLSMACARTPVVGGAVGGVNVGVAHPQHVVQADAQPALHHDAVRVLAVHLLRQHLPHPQGHSTRAQTR